MPLNPKWPISNFSFLQHSWIIRYDHENKGNDRKPRRLLISYQILLVTTLKNVKRMVWRKYILMLGCKGLKLTSGEKVCVIVSPLAQVHFIECNPSLYRTDDCASADVAGTLKASISEAASNVYSWLEEMS